MRTILEVAGCLLWTACAAPVGDSALADCEAQDAESRERAVRDCACEREGHGFGLCASSPGPDAATCACAIAASDPDNAEILACRARREAEYTACFAPLACDDSAGKTACRAIYVAGLQTCGELSKASRGEVLLECEDRPAFACGSGERIPTTHVCDLEVDCVDMSDEADALCAFVCEDGAGIPRRFACDGKADCDDMSDEADCDGPGAQGVSVRRLSTA